MSQPELPRYAYQPTPLPEPPEPKLSDLFGMLMRRRWLIAGCVFIAGGAGIAYTIHARPVYESTALVRFESEKVDLPQLVQMLSSDNLISTEIEVLQGRGATAAVVDSLGLRANLLAPRKARVTSIFAVLRVDRGADSGSFVLSPTSGGAFRVTRPNSSATLGIVTAADSTRVAGVLMQLGPDARTAPEIRLHIDQTDLAIARWKRAMTISRPARDADVISITVRSGDPVQGAAAANLMAANLIADRRSARRSSSDAAVAFLQQQSDSLGRQLRFTEDSLRTYQEQQHVIDVPQQASAEVTRLATMQANLAGVRAERDAFAALVQQFRQDSLASPSTAGDVSRRLMAFPSLLSNQSAAVLLGSLAQAESERSQLLIRRTPADSDVQTLTQRIRGIESQLSGIAESYLQSLTNQVISLDGQSAKFSTALSALPAKELATARFERNAKVLNDLWVLVQTRLKEAEVTGVAGDPAVRIADVAAPALRASKPKPLINVILALLLGGMLGVGAALVRELSDDSVRSREDAQVAGGGLPVLGALPRMRLAKMAMGVDLLASDKALDEERERTAGSIASQLVTNAAVSATYTESLNQLFASLALGFSDKPPKVVVITSPLPGEGKTLSAINFALVAASRGLRVLLIDADLRCGVINTSLGLRRAPGLSELLAGGDAAQSLQTVPMERGALSVLASGAFPKFPGSLLTIERVRNALDQVIANYDFVVIDTPPVNLLADAGVLGSAADAVLLVARVGHTQASDLAYAMEQLEGMRAPVIGTLLNDIDLRRNARDDGSYRYLAAAERYHVSTS
jgi:tyrosine-protein kinase Etk/Wzc